MKFLIINGVNLNLTGVREKSVYGARSLAEINEKIAAYCASRGDETEFFQSNAEGEICDKLHEAYLKRAFDGIAFSHYSYAIRDAVAAIDVPVAEVHMSNIAAREEFRKKSVLSEVCRGVVFGFGAASYLAALEGLKESLTEEMK